MLLWKQHQWWSDWQLSVTWPFRFEQRKLLALLLSSVGITSSDMIIGDVLAWNVYQASEHPWLYKDCFQLWCILCLPSYLLCTQKHDKTIDKIYPNPLVPQNTVTVGKLPMSTIGCHFPLWATSHRELKIKTDRENKDRRSVSVTGRHHPVC